MFEKIINNTEELNAMAMHLRMSQNFSELQALAAEWLVPEQDVEDFISGKRFQLAEIPLSEKEYTSAAEKLREEMWLLKDQLFTDVVARHLIQKAEEDMLFGFRVLKKQKTIQKCMDYIMEQAYKMAEKEQEKKSGGKQNTSRRAGSQNQAVGMGVAETLVYQWAEEYYALEDAAKEAKEQAAEKKKRLSSLKKKENRKKNTAAYKKSIPYNSSKEAAALSMEKGEEGQEPKDAPVQEEKKPKKEQGMEGVQLSMFDLMAGTNQEKPAEDGNEGI